MDITGAAILPCDFLPTMVDKLPEQWFYATYRWYKYFDKKQRTKSGDVASSNALHVADTENVAKWKKSASTIFDQSFNKRENISTD